MSRVRLAASALLVVAWLGAAEPARAAAPPSGAIVVVGVPALAWDDVTEAGTPTLWRLAGEGAIGSLSVRAIADQPHEETPPYDGWASLGAGNRASGVVLRGYPDAGPGLPRGMSLLRSMNASYADAAVPGALGTSLRDASVKRVAFGPGATVALADDRGGVDIAYSAAAALENFELLLAGAVQERAVVAVEVRDLMEATTPAGLGSVDAALAVVARNLTPQDTLIVVGVSDRIGAPARLRVALARGPGFAPGLLRSPTTRRDGYVQLLDVAPSILQISGIENNVDMIGRPWQSRRASAPPVDRVRALVDADLAAGGYRRHAAAFFVVAGIAQLLFYAVAFVLLRQRESGHVRMLRRVALYFAALPATTYLAHLFPWWRHPLGVLLAVTSVLAAILALVALRGPWRSRPLGPEGFTAGATFAIIGIDLLTGARLQLSSVAGYSPLVAGRFAGVGNVAFAVFGTAALLLAVALCVGLPTVRALVSVSVVAVTAIVIDGNPLWGSDFGGVLALVPAFAVLALLVSDRTLSWRRLVLIAVAALGAVAALALLDFARSPEVQTHLGRFVGQLRDGRAGAIVARKASANLALLTRGPVTVVVPLVLAAFAFALLRPSGTLRRTLEGMPALRSGLVGVLVLSVVGLLVNDSGIAVPALALSIAVPLTFAASMRYADAPTGRPAGED